MIASRSKKNIQKLLRRILLHVSSHTNKTTSGVRLFVQPDDGIQPIVDALQAAKHSIHILIFRFDRKEIEQALVEAANRGVLVHALIAYTNTGGDKNLRKFEMRLLEKGITVARTADDLVRYHGKMFIIDEKELHLLAFNFTHMDISLSRSFSLRITEKNIVDEAMRLFEADTKRTEFKSRVEDLVVSPSNSREVLSSFIAGAKKQLLMYEMKVSDREFIRLLKERAADGVDVRVIGRGGIKGAKIPARSLPQRLHARAILRDGKAAFLGSQSLRKLELEARREIGVVVHDTKVVSKMIKVFEDDWKRSEPILVPDEVEEVLDVPAKKVAKKVAKEIEVKPVLEKVLAKALNGKDAVSVDPDEVAKTVRAALREEIHEAVVEALKDTAVESQERESK